MREIRSSGSARGVRRNPYPYRDSPTWMHGIDIRCNNYFSNWIAPGLSTQPAP
jgi:hypothetical protein